MLHSLVCCNEDGYVLLAKYFRQPPLSLEARKKFEAQLVAVQPTHVWEQMKKDQQDQFLVCDGQFVVLRQIGELRLYLAGSEEYDELMCNVQAAVVAAGLAH